VLEVRERLPALRHGADGPRGAAHHLADGKCITFDRLLALGAERPRGEYDESVDHLAMETTAILVYTSGTTGPPKGAMLTHGNLRAAGEAWGRAMTGGPGDELLSYLPLCHIAERLLSGINPLTKGYRVNFGGGGEELVADLREVQPTLFFGVPRVWEKMLAGIEIRMNDASGSSGSTMPCGCGWPGGWRASGCRGASGSPTACCRAGLAAPLPAVRERLGLARAVGRVGGADRAGARVLLGHRRPDPRGLRPDRGQRHGDLQPARRGAPWHSGHPAARVRGADRRRRRDPDPVHRRLRRLLPTGSHPGHGRRRGWLQTGDVGELDADGFLHHRPQEGPVITAGGKNISPSWIENRLKCSPYVREAIVIGDRRRYVSALIGIELDTVGDWATRRRLAFTTYKDLSEQPEVRRLISEWVDEVNAELAQVEQVKRFTLLPKELDHEEGELTATQKVKRRAIVALRGPRGSMYRDRLAHPSRASLGPSTRSSASPSSWCIARRAC
jgi:long-chain acyl-CoA synthetase